MMTLFRKELLEQRRTYRGLIIVALFVFFGLSSPLIAKVLPDIIESLVVDGMVIQLPEPTWLDAFGQFFDNVVQMGLLALILTSMGLVAEEKAKSTALLVLARPIARSTFVWAKFAALSVVLALATLLSYLACLYYAWVLFRPFPVLVTVEATATFFVYALFIGALTLCASCLVQSGPAAGGLAVAGFFVVSILPSLHRLAARYSPGALGGMTNRLMTGQMSLGEAAPALAITLALALVLVAVGSWAFSRQEI